MIVSKTPVRIGFVGGGSDLREYYEERYGAVVNATINKYVYVMANRRFDSAIRIAYSKSETVENINEVEHDIIRESLRLLDVQNSIDMSYLADIAVKFYGTGLGSSSSLTVGVLKTLYELKNENINPERLAKEACMIEIDILKRPGGKQDQHAAAYGGFNYMRFNSDETVSVQPIQISSKTLEMLHGNLMLFYTGMATGSNKILDKQKKRAQHNSQSLHAMVRLAETMKKALEKNDISAFGEMLHENWMYKKELADGITNNILDEYYEKIRQAGAKGGKILGSGGGGFLLVYCERELQENVRKVLVNCKETAFAFEPRGSHIAFHD